MLSCGSSWVGFYPISERSSGIAAGLLVDPFLSPDGPWAAMYSLPKVGVSIDKFIETLGKKEEKKRSVELFDQYAAEVGPGAQ